eukprot:3940236-Rhodomonas_salina.10
MARAGTKRQRCDPPCDPPLPVRYWHPGVRLYCYQGEKTPVECTSSLPSQVSAIGLRVCYTMSAIGLRACYAMPVCCYAVCGTELAYAATRHRVAKRLPLLPPRRYSTNGLPTRLRACYAMSGTDLAYGGLRRCLYLSVRCYAQSGTEIAYAAISDEGIEEQGRRVLEMLGTPILLDAMLL